MERKKRETTPNTVQVISRRVVGRAGETSTYSSLGFCTVNCRPTASNYKILKVKVTTVMSKVKSKINHDVAHLHPLTNVPTKYPLTTPNGFRNIAWTRFTGQGHYSKVKGQIKVGFLRYSPDKIL